MSKVEHKSLTDKHIVLDLDSTLIHTFSYVGELDHLKMYSSSENADMRPRVYSITMLDVSMPEGTGVETHMNGVFRPHLQTFIDFIFKYFAQIHIWSAGKYKYVMAIKQQIFPNPKLQPTKTLTYTDCIFQGDFIFKPLSKIYNFTGGLANIYNTLALDDRKDTFSHNPNNGIQISRYEPTANRKSIMQDEVSLLQLMYWLSLREVRDSKDVTSLNKATIFTTPVEEYLKILNPLSPMIKEKPKGEYHSELMILPA